MSRAAAGPGDDAHLVERPVAASTLLAGGFLEVHRDTVALPDGRQVTREYIRHPGAVAVVPLLDDGRVVLVRQYRYPVAKVLLEWPAGKRDGGESTFTCAARELLEETGYTATEWAFGGEIHNAAAYSSESIWIWFARGLVAGAAKPDDGEFVETVHLALDELQALSLQGGLPDVKTQIGLAWLHEWRAGLRPLAWLGADEAAALR
ncbi:MAG: NUDIX hydrolase [Rubrivivax sp.]|nr:NUDIX hydrolase [Rubrivivax sp.]